MPELPRPTEDLESALEQLRTFGYAMLANRIAGPRLRGLRERLVELAAEDRAAGRATNDAGGANQRIWHLVNRSADLRELAVEPAVLEVLGRLLGHPPPVGADDLPHFLLSNMTANIAGPGGEPMDLHADQYFLPLPWPDFPSVANVIWTLDDFTESVGATRVVPGSHQFQASPVFVPTPPSIPLEAPAGTAVVLDGRTWHGTGSNQTQRQQRHAVLAFYCTPWIRQQENFTASTEAKIAETSGPLLRRLLGFDAYRTLGQISDQP